MTENELLQLLNELEIHYPYFQVNQDIEREWYKIMHNFSYEDVMKNLHIAMGEEKYRNNPPQAYYLIQGLTPVHKKISFKNRSIFCKICNRILQPEEEQKHFDRCLSINYMLRQFKRFHIQKSFNKRALYEMNQEQFNKTYEKLLRWIQKHTLDESEKVRIEFIFNPPNAKIARKYLNQNR